jgi:hypothetical protein
MITTKKDKNHGGKRMLLGMSYVHLYWLPQVQESNNVDLQRPQVQESNNVDLQRPQRTNINKLVLIRSYRFFSFTYFPNHSTEKSYVHFLDHGIFLWVSVIETVIPCLRFLRFR